MDGSRKALCGCGLGDSQLREGRPGLLKALPEFCWRITIINELDTNFKAFDGICCASVLVADLAERSDFAHRLKRRLWNLRSQEPRLHQDNQAAQQSLRLHILLFPTEHQSTVIIEFSERLSTSSYYAKRYLQTVYTTSPTGFEKNLFSILQEGPKRLILHLSVPIQLL